MNNNCDFKILNSFIENDPLCQHAIKELSIAGYFNSNIANLFNLAKRVLNNVAIYSLQRRSDAIDYREIELTKILCMNDVICPLTLQADEFYNNSIGKEFINIRQHNIIKDSHGIYDKNAYKAVFNQIYQQDTKEIKNIPNYVLGIADYFIEINDNEKCTGRILTKAYIKQTYIDKQSYIPKTTINIYSVAKSCANHEVIYFVNTNKNNSFDVLNDAYNIHYEYFNKIKNKHFSTISNITINKFLKSIKIK